MNRGSVDSFWSIEYNPRWKRCISYCCRGQSHKIACVGVFISANLLFIYLKKLRVYLLCSVSTKIVKEQTQEKWFSPINKGYLPFRSRKRQVVRHITDRLKRFDSYNFTAPAPRNTQLLLSIVVHQYERLTQLTPCHAQHKSTHSRGRLQ